MESMIQSDDTERCNKVKMWLLVSLVISIGSRASVDCLPVKLVADFPSYAINILGGPADVHPLDPMPNLLVTSASSTSYLYRNPISDDDSEDLAEAAFAANPRGSNVDYAEQVVDAAILAVTTTSNSNETTMNNATTTKASAADLQEKQNNTNTTTLSSRFMIANLGSRKSNIIRLPNGQSYHICDENTERKCEDENAVCELGACVCKDGFFANRQSGLCQSIGDMLKNCENDLHCQAFNVDLVCDTKSHERPFCDCTDGLYFDQETHTCLPCHRNTWLVHTTNIKGPDQMLWLANMSIESLAPLSLNADNPANSSQQPTLTPAPAGQTTGARSTQLRPCKPIDLVRLSSRRRQNGLPHYTSNYEQPFRGSSSLSAGATTTSHLAASSDPFRIKVPLEVFMGAIILFTLFTVAWFLLQRMIHDCRFKILRSLHNPDFTGASYPELQSSFASSGSSIARARSTNHLYFDPTSQTVARLFTATDRSTGNSSAGGAAYSAHSPFAGPYQRDLAGIMVQHLAANLSPSSTSQALAVGPNGSAAIRNLLAGQSDHEAALYPLTASAQQTRTAAAAAAAQLLLSPTHPAIAILRAAAASAAQSPGTDYTSANMLCSIFDPPPKYEEAVAQAAAAQLSVTPAQQYTIEGSPLSASQLDSSNNPPTEAPLDGQASNEQDAQAAEIVAMNEGQAITHHNVEGSRGDGASLPGTISVSTMLSVRVSPIEEQQHSDDLLAMGSSLVDDGTAQNFVTEPRSDSSSNGAQQRESSSANHIEASSQQRRQNSTNKRVSRRSRRGRGSLSWSQQRHQKQRQQTQDSDDTLED